MVKEIDLEILTGLYVLCLSEYQKNTFYVSSVCLYILGMYAWMNGHFSSP
jgi:hypothetical protein